MVPSNRAWALLLVLVLLQCGPSVLLASETKAVDLSLSAPWPSYPLSAEISEFVHRSYSSSTAASFWRFFEGVSVQNAATQREDYEQAMQVATGLLSEVRGGSANGGRMGMLITTHTQTQLGLLSLALDLRYYNPLVHSHQQRAQQIRSMNSGVCTLLYLHDHYIVD